MSHILKRTAIDLTSSPVKRQKTNLKIMTEVLSSPVKSFSDKKNYRLIQLPNGLKALLIQHFIENNSDNDEKSEASSSQEVDENSQDSKGSAGSSEEEEDEESSNKEKLAAVALCINIGSFSDPPEVQGLSHFLEHMIFMGSKKYPKENEYDQFISNNGGSNNAHTECEYTAFYFDITEDHLNKAMDIFAQLFIDPLIDSDSMDREIEAVESEFQNSLNDDQARALQLFAQTANGPASTFTWGNRKTLKEGLSSEKVYKIVHEFRKNHYIANKMFLCVQSTQNLDDLQKLVEDNFNEVKSGEELNVFEVPDQHFKPEFFDKVYYLKPKADKTKLYITFLLPSMKEYYRSKPHDYLAFLIHHEGVGSLSSYLKNRLLALRIDAGVEDQSYEGNSMFSLFSIDVTLTDAGYENVHQVLEAIFSYLLLLKTTSIKEHEKIFEELKQIKDTQFKFKEEKSPIDNVEELAVNMMFYNSQDIINGSDIYFDFDPIMIQKLVEKMNEGKFNLFVVSNKHEKFDKVEKWFGTEYEEVDYPEDYKSLWLNRELKPELSMPSPNEFICTKFDILSADLEPPTLPQMPQKLYENEVSECFYKLDYQFKLPHAMICVHLMTPKPMKSVENSTYSHLFTTIFKHYMAERLYPAVCAGLGYQFYWEEKGFLIKLSGYNEKLPLLLDIITKSMKTLGDILDEETFKTLQKQMKKNAYNALIQSKEWNKQLRLQIVDDNHSFLYEKYHAVDLMNFEDFKKFSKDMIKSLKLQFLYEGNISKEIAIESSRNAIENLKFDKIPKELEVHPRTVRIPVGSNILSVRSILKNDKNSSLTNYIQLGESSIKLQSLIDFVVQIMEEPLFDILRTKEQLGYSVDCSYRFNNGILGLTVFVQSQENKNPVKIVYEKVENFLQQTMNEIMEKLSDEEFEKHQQALIKTKNLIDDELHTEVTRDWAEITSQEYIFNRRQLEAEMIGRITKGEVVEFYRNRVTAADARKLSIQVVGYETEVENVDQEEKVVLEVFKSEITPGNVILNIEEFKNSLEKFPVTKTSITDKS